MTSSEAYLEYKSFISNVAKLVKRDTRIRTLDIDDLEQDGIVFLLQIWQRQGLPEEERVMLFTSSLEGHLRNIVKFRYLRDNRCAFLSSIHRGKNQNVLDCMKDDDPASHAEAADLREKLWNALDGTGKVLLTELLALEDRSSSLTATPGFWWTEIRKKMGLSKKQMRLRRATLMKKAMEILDG